MLDSSRSGTFQPEGRPLVTKKLNIVGESHTESGPRRPLERQFAAATTLSVNYWTEAEFFDLYKRPGARKAQVRSAAADLMEYRAVHGAAMLIGSYEGLAKKAVTFMAAPSDAAFNDFVGVRIPEFLAFRDKLNTRWRPTETAEVNDAVQNVYIGVEKLCQKYLQVITGATAQQKIGKTKILADNVTVLRSFVPPLAKAVGVTAPPDNDAAALAKAMREERSKFMGLAAVVTTEAGVWKVGDLHIVDLLNGAVNIDTTRFNIVTRDQFNLELKVWQDRLAK